MTVTKKILVGAIISALCAFFAYLSGNLSTILDTVSNSQATQSVISQDTVKK